MQRITRALLSAVVALLLVLSGGAVASAVGYAAGSTVGTVPTRTTPQVLDGRVLSVVKVGGTIVLGGEFTQVTDYGSDVVQTRSNVLAFDAATGKVSSTFAPNPNGPVNVVLPAGDGESVYVGGSFSSIGGLARTNLVRVRVSDGAVMAGFDAGKVAGQVKDLRLSNGRLFVAGMFTHIGGSAQKALATINPTTGKFDPTFMRPVLAGTHNGGTTGVQKIDIDPQGTRLVAIGNFDTVNGTKTHQIAMLDVTGATAALAPFRSSFYEAACSSSFDSYMRDLDFSPDGTFFVVSTTGAYGGAGAACDSTARFERDAGAGATPTWVNNTGGDTTYAVEITDSVVYTGGHARWQNNPFRADTPGQGAVSRPGIAALDPINGLPLSWNPTRARGVGVFDLLVTEAGLYVGSDTTRIGADFLRQRIALLPAAGGSTWKGVRTPTLPNDVYQTRSTTQTSSFDKRSTADGSSFGNLSTVANGGLTTRNIKGAFMLNGWLYVAWSDGSLDKRTFDGTTYGPAEAVDTGDELAAMTDWDTDIRSMTGMFYDEGRIYFTRSGTNALYYRYFTPESDVVGAQRLTASTGTAGINFSQVRGAFLAGSTLYWQQNGQLRSLPWTRTAKFGAPGAGNATVVNSSSWTNTVAMFLYQDADGDGPAIAPTASFTSRCDSLSCSFDASGSSATNASIASYEWDFGDGATGTGKVADHVYTGSGTRTVTLKVTTTKGLTSTTTRTVAVTRTNQLPTASFTSSCDDTACAFDASGSSDPDGTVAGYSWDFGDSTTGSGAKVDHSFPAAGTYQVTLTVTDDEGGRATRTLPVQVTESKVAFVASASTNGNRTNHTVTVPAGVSAGDRLLLLMTTNSSTATIAAPDGWTEAGTADVDGLRTRLWTRAATAADAGTVVTVPTSAAVKSNLTVAAYRSTGAHPVQVAATTASTTASSATSLTSPTAEAAAGSWLVSYYGAKSSSTLALGTPAAQARRTGSEGTGSGAIFAALSDSDGQVGPGTVGGLTVDAGGSASRSGVLTVVLAPSS